MKTISMNFWKKMFFVGSLWNLGIAITSLLFTNFMLMMMFGKGPIEDNLLAFINGTVPVTDNLQILIFFRFFMIAVMLFGIGYYIVSRDLLANRAVVWLGLIAKLVIFFTFVYYYALGQAAWFPVFVLSGDFIFSILFIMFLYQTKDGID